MHKRESDSGDTTAKTPEKAEASTVEQTSTPSQIPHQSPPVVVMDTPPTPTEDHDHEPEVDIIFSTVQDEDPQNEGGDGDQAGQDADEEDGGTEDEDEDDILPSDVIPPKPTGDRRLSIQMGAVMVSFDVDCHENDDVDEKDLLSGYKTPTYNTAESPVMEHQSPEHALKKKRSRDEMQTLLKEHQEIVNKLKEQERNLSDSEHQDQPSTPSQTPTPSIPPRKNPTPSPATNPTSKSAQE